MPGITDSEFGEIKVVRSARASQVRIKVGTDGILRASAPPYVPLFIIKRLVSGSRQELRTMLAEHSNGSVFREDEQIGKSHTLVVRPSNQTSPSVSRHGQQIIVSLPETRRVEEKAVQDIIRPVVIEALRKEAKSYLPRRLSFLAKQHGFSYERVRFSHAGSRWGSCSSSGTISLNIALMKLPFPLIDYVLIHELSHTIEMNHSEAFWDTVERCDPNYKAARRALKRQTPSI